MDDEKRKSLRDEFSGLLDKELDPETRATVEAELAQDAALLRELESWKKVDALYRDLSRHNAPDNFESRVQAAIAQNVIPFNPGSTRKWLSPLLTFAATLALLSGLYFAALQTAPDSNFQITKAPEEPAAALENKKQDSTESSALDEGTRTQSTAAETSLRDEDAHITSIAEMPEADFGAAAGMPAEEPMQVSADPKPLMEAEEDSALGRFKSEQPEMQSLPAPPPAPTAPGAFMLESAPAESNEVFMRQNDDLPTPTDVPNTPVPEPVAMESPAPMADAEKSAKDKRITSPFTVFDSLRHQRQSATKLPAKEESADSKNIGARAFVFENGVWLETAYADENPTYLVKGSEDFKKLAEAHPELPEIAALGDYVLVRIADDWYFIYSANANG